MNINWLVSSTAVVAGVWLFSSCTRLDTTSVGNELIPAVDNVHTFDTTLEVITDNFLMDDSTRLSKTGLHALGVIANDPAFGKTTAAIYCALQPGYYGIYPFVNQPDSITLDSVVLSLSYNRLYGDSLAVERVEVREIDPAGTFRDSAYLISEPGFALAAPLLGAKTVNFQSLADSLSYIQNTDTIRTAKELRIPLDISFGQRLVDYDTATVYKNDTTFKTHFKGLAITVNEGASPAARALAYFDLSGTRLTFYYRVQKNGATDTTSTAFLYNYAAHANLVHRTPANAWQTYLGNGHGDNDDEVYLQSAPGSYASIEVPGLSSLSNRVIHKAELIIEPVPAPGDALYGPPQQLFVDAYDAGRDLYRTIQNDFYQVGTGTYNFSSFGGYLINGRYTFNLSRYVQGIVTRGEDVFQLRLSAPYLTWPVYVPPGRPGQYNLSDLKAGQDAAGFAIPVNPFIASGRVVLGGGSHPSHRMRLRIIYSNI